MAILKHIRRSNFVSIPNELAQLAQTGKITYESLGLLIDLLSRPDNWIIHKSFYRTTKAGEIVINRIFKELQELGYLHLRDMRDCGKIIDRYWIITDEPRLSSEIIENSLDFQPPAKPSKKDQNILDFKDTKTKSSESHIKTLENLNAGKPQFEETSIRVNPELQINIINKKDTINKKDNTYMSSNDSTAQDNEDDFKNNKDFDTTPINPTNKKALDYAARQILHFLRVVSGTEFRDVDTHLDKIKARLKSGVTLVDCMGVVKVKADQWRADDKMACFLRPATLFAKTNFEEYLAEFKTKIKNNGGQL